MAEHSRSFTQGQKTELFIQANGVCQMCGESLQTSWHADHIFPYTKGGKTLIENGQALCAKCNRIKKDAIMESSENKDTIQLRESQQEMETAAFSVLEQGRKSMICVLACSSGKTLGALNICNALFRKGIIDGAIFLTPRTALCSQYQWAWDESKSDEDFSQYYSEPKIHGILRRENKPPILFENQFGYSLTYSSLVSDMKSKKLHLNSGRHCGIVQRKFALILDEAQALSKQDEKAFTASVRQLYEHPNCIFTIVMSATPVRSDRFEVFCGRYSPPDEQGRRYLEPDVSYTYRDSVADGYSRPYEFHLETVSLDINRLTDIISLYSDEINVTEAATQLEQFMRQEAVWQTLVDKTIKQLLDVRMKFWKGYKALIAAIDVRHAREVSAYLTKTYPTLKHLTVYGETTSFMEEEPSEITESVGAVSSTLNDFSHGGHDILISVRKAYIGYNYPPITVVGVLTHWRFSGFLEQLTGRGGRIYKHRPKNEQVLQVIGLKDPAMEKFAEDMRTSTLDYLIEKGERSREREGTETTRPLEFIQAVNIHGWTAKGWNELGDLDIYEYQPLIDTLKRENIPCHCTIAAQIIRASNGNIALFTGGLAFPETITTQATIKTHRAAIEELIREVTSLQLKADNGTFSQNEFQRIWRQKKLQLSKKLFPNGINNFHKQFKSEQDMMVGFVEKQAQLLEEKSRLKRELRKKEA